MTLMPTLGKMFCFISGPNQRFEDDDAHTKVCAPRRCQGLVSVSGCRSLCYSLHQQYLECISGCENEDCCDYFQMIILDVHHVATAR